MKDGEDERGVGDEKLKSGSLEGRNGGDGSIAIRQVAAPVQSRLLTPDVRLLAERK